MLKIFKIDGTMPKHLILCNDYKLDYKQFFLFYYGEEVQTTRAYSYLEALKDFIEEETDDVLFI